jgi:hypothetical protein
MATDQRSTALLWPSSAIPPCRHHEACDQIALVRPPGGEALDENADVVQERVSDP